MSEALLEKTETVLELQETRGAVGESPRWFGVPDNEELQYATVVLPERDWEELGQPTKITVAIWAGDRLQDERAVREVIPGAEWADRTEEARHGEG